MRVRLEGCTSQPLGSYLKSLAVLRVVSEQVDEGARGWWEDGCFQLESNLGREELTRFFLEQYRPTPIIAPWNGGSGFYPNDRKIGLDGIVASTSARFTAFRTAIAFAQSLDEVATAAQGIAENDKNELRSAILRRCRNEFPDTAVEWLDAAIAINSDNKRDFAPIFGTGGNEGRLDYTNNFMEYLVELLLADDSWRPV